MIPNFNTDSAKPACFLTGNRKRDKDDGVIRTGVEVPYLGVLDISVSAAEQLAKFVGFLHPGAILELEEANRSLALENRLLQVKMDRVKNFLDPEISDEPQPAEELTTKVLPPKGRPRVPWSE